MQKKLSIISFLWLLSVSVPAYAQLSANPWTRPNDQEEIEKVYERRKQLHGSVTSYTPEEETVIDRSSAYIEVSDEEEVSEDASMLDKFKSKFKKKETHLVANTAENRAALERRKSMAASRSNARGKTIKQNMQSMGLGNFGDLGGMVPSGEFNALINKAKSTLRQIGKQFQ